MFCSRGWRLFAAALVWVGGAACSDDTAAAGGSGGAGASSAGGAAATGGASPTGGASTAGGGAVGGAGGAASTGGAGGGVGGSSGQGGGTCQGLAGMAGDTDFTLDWDGATRHFKVHAPPGYDPTAPTPVALVFHGYTEDGDQIETISEMSPAADAKGFLVVYADGLGTSWNAGACCGSSAMSGVDDVGFVGALIDHVASQYCVDDKRVFSAGFSNGGMLSQRLACELADRIAAIGPVAGPIAFSPCTPSRPVPVMEFHGTADPIVSYNGGGLSSADSVPDTIAAWVARNGCSGTPVVSFQQGDATCEAYGSCEQGADVVLCTLSGDGHQWPGGQSAGAFFGSINMDIEASPALLDFFLAHPMP